ncbi:DUF4235 domain-containing protein [Microlunatus ginsengisoli]|uniref:DUF4235 domain-containing protein n=1 Tax=Microlunatus ginsengisoli TaxID=363863 RepID=A0ABP7A304_9ACTN
MGKTTAKLAYRPVGLVSSVVAGAAAAGLFKALWGAVGRGKAPDALQSKASIGEILLAATLQGAIFAAVNALVNRLGARAFQKVTGSWPGK